MEMNPKIAADIMAERARQDEAFGGANHEPVIWAAILTKQAGHVADAALELRYGVGLGNADDRDYFRNELIQVAAVAIAAIEDLDMNCVPDREG